MDTGNSALLSLYAQLCRHMAFDLLPLLALGLLLSLAMGDRSEEGKGRGRAVAISMVGLSLGVVAIAHIRVLNSLVKLSELYWVHRIALAVIFGAVALPLAFAVGRWRRLSGYILVAGVITWVPVIVQVIPYAMKGATTIEDIDLKRSYQEIQNANNRQDPGALARALERLKIPSDTAEFDTLLYPAVLELIKSPQPEVARAAARKVEARGDPAALAPLLLAKSDAPPIARDAIEAAIRTLSQKEGSRDILFRVLMENKGRPRADALALLDKYHTSFLREKLEFILRTGDDELRGIVTALLRGSAAGSQGDLVSPLMKALLSADPAGTERSRALESLLTLISNPGVKEKIDPKPLINILEVGTREQRRSAAKLLRELKTQDSIPAFTKAAASDDAAIARISLEALLSMNAAKDPATFAKYIESEEAPMRALAFRGLKETLPRNLNLDDPLLKRIENAARKEKDSEARRYAAVLLAWLDLKDAFSYAESLLAEGAKSDDKLAAIAAFDLLGERRVVPKLTTLAKDGSPKVRRAAAEALGHTGDQAVLATLKRMLNDPDSSVRDAAQAAIQEFIAQAPREVASPEQTTPPATKEQPLPKPPPGPPPETPPW